MTRARSLNIEHVSLAALMQQEISRHTSLGVSANRALQRGSTVPDETLLAVLRRWFWMRKPDAGFILTGFPATLLQALVFDEWMETRDEALHGAFCFDSVFASSGVAKHYRTLGFLPGEAALAL